MLRNKMILMSLSVLALWGCGGRGPGRTNENLNNNNNNNNGAPECGDGVVEAEEECDDGANGDPCDGCLDDCTTHTNVCGDGYVCETEECDEGGETSSCDGDCTAVECGDGRINTSAGEVCDGDDVQGETCVTQGCEEGALACGEGCLSFDVSECGFCGWTEIVAGKNSSCAFEQQKEAWCWGWNAYGQLGDGTEEDRAVPGKVHDLTGIVSLSVGSGHACAVRADGTVWCWGQNGSGKLGDGTDVNRRVPVRVQGIDDAVSVTAGGAHSCALSEAGEVYCWGYNAYGQLGDGATTNRLTPVLTLLSTPATEVEAGGAHTCAVIPGDPLVLTGQTG